MKDWELLNEYVEHESQEAFEKLVRNYTPMVYACAIRRAGRQHADDITQAVFIILARKAHKLRRRQAARLASWIYKATQFASYEAIRREQRQKNREYIAAEQEIIMREETHEDESWPQISQYLESAIEKLSIKDREAILLRFFRGLSYIQIGYNLGISENAATQRVSRATEKLRHYFKRKDILFSASALSNILGREISGLVSSNLPELQADTIITMAANTQVPGTASILSQCTAKAMTIAYIKTSIAIIAVSIMVAIGGFSIFNNMPTKESPLFSLKKITAFPFRYTARSTLPDGKIQFQINATGSQKTWFIGLGENTDGFQAVKHQTDLRQRLVPGIANPQEADMSKLTLKDSSGKETVLTIDPKNHNNIFTAHIIYNPDNTDYYVYKGDIFSVDDQNYSIIEITPEENSITLLCINDNRSIVIRANH